MTKPHPDITLFSRRPFPGQFSIENVFSSLLPFFKKQFATDFYELKHFSKGVFPRISAALDAKKHQSKVNHVTGDITFITPFLNGHNTIVTIHDNLFVARQSGLKRMLLQTLWLSWPLKHARIVTTISEYSKMVLLRDTNIPPEKIRVVHNPLTLSIDQVKPSTKQPNPKPVLLQIGTKANKNLFRLAEAIKGMDVLLVIIGKLSANQIEYLKDRNIDYHNRWDLSEAALVKEYQTADVLTFVSESEGFGLPIIEANYLGCPVVTSNTTSMPEVAENAAFLVDPYSIDSIRSGIERVLQDEALRQRLIENGFENVKRFEPQQIASKYLELYKEILTD